MTVGPDHTVGPDYTDLGRRLAGAAPGYARADPFPHAVFDGLFDPGVLRAVAAEFPDPESMGERFMDRYEYAKFTERRWDHFGPATRSLLAELQSGSFLECLTSLTGIPELISDPLLFGGGQHQIGPGGLLKVHADFSTHEVYGLDRRLNLLLYLNDPWDPAWGGQLELWDRDMTRCVERVDPVMGRVVVFSTTSTSYHGHPDPLRTPEGVLRRSLALYYYTNGRPEGEVDESHNTLFQSRPGHGADDVDDLGLRLRRTAKRWLPPAVADLLRRGAPPPP